MTLKEIATYLPTRTELERLMAARAAMSTSKVFALISLGALIGAGAALLCAPRPGRELRESLTHRVGEMREHLRHGPNGQGQQQPNA